MRRLAAFLLFLIAPPAFAGTTFWMTLGGNDSNAGTSEATAVRTSTKAFTLMTPGAGDVLMIGTGTWTSGINLSSPVYGTSSALTYYKAKTDGQVIIQQTNWLDQTHIADKYIQYEGLYSSGTFQKNIVGGYQKFLRMIFRGGQTTSNAHNVAVGTAGQRTHHILIEDSFFFGPGGRYNVIAYESDKVILRRVIIRHDGGWSDGATGDPEAAAAVYASSDTLSLNVGVFDSTGTAPTYHNWSQAFYNIGGPNRTNKWLGCLVLNSRDSAFVMDSAATGNLIEHSVFWDVAGGISFGNADSSATVRNVTIGRSGTTFGSSWTGGIAYFGAGSTSKTVKDSIIYGMAGTDIAGLTPDPSYFNTNSNGGTNYTNATGRTTFNPLTNGLTYLPRRETSSVVLTTTSAGGEGQGATLKEYGVSGTWYGEAGYDQVVDDNWLDNATFAAMAAIVKPLMQDYQPRGWSSTSNTQTFCEYVYGYLGNGTPSGACSSESSSSSGSALSLTGGVTMTGSVRF